MTEPRFTPGPWEIAHDDNGQANINGPDNGFWIALLPHQCVTSIEEQQERNAQLIVAAPDLYECLEVVAADSWVNLSLGDQDRWLKRSAAALARAKGE